MGRNVNGKRFSLHFKLTQFGKAGNVNNMLSGPGSRQPGLVASTGQEARSPCQLGSEPGGQELQLGTTSHISGISRVRKPGGQDHETGADRAGEQSKAGRS